MSNLIRALTVRELENLFVPTLRNCTNSKGLKRIHANVVKLSLSQSNFLVTKMVDVCDNLGDSSYAGLLFDQVPEPNLFLYNATIRVYARCGTRDTYALSVALYRKMMRERHVSSVSPNHFTFPFLLKSCSGFGCVSLGMQVHGHVIRFGLESHYMVENGLLDMYVKCESLRLAHKVFDEMRERDVVCWNTLLSGYARAGEMSVAKGVFDRMLEKSIISWTVMISGYTGTGCYAAALDIFREMQGSGVEPDEVSMVSVLPACAQLGALEIGKWIHIYCDRNGLSRSTSVCNALIEMYAKCGCIDSALQLFNRMLKRDVISWSTMISGLSNHGKAREAIELFRAMKRANVVPNRITFLGLLSACVHAGLILEGLEYFDSMKREYSLEPEVEHYGCLVDLLGRSGRLEQALETISKMPMKPDSKIWGSLLSSCRVHRNIDIAVIAMKHLSEFEPDDMGNYVLLSYIYADIGRWDQVAEIRRLIRSKCMWKIPGCSSIEVNNIVEEFVSGDDSKPYLKDLLSILELLSSSRNLGTDEIIGISLED